MATITYKNNPVVVAEPYTVLEGLEKAGFDIPFSCRSGLCHSCLMQADEKPPVNAQSGLTDSQKEQNFFLACSCIPHYDMDVSLIGDRNKTQATVVDKKMLNDKVLALFLHVDFTWLAGQYLTVWHDDIQGRSYSIASRCTEERVIELHIKRHEHGLLSRWLHDDVIVGQSLTLSKPMGHCFYGQHHHGKSILMVSTGTGLAPLVGILKEALSQQHQASIFLYAAAGSAQDLYYQSELKDIAKAYPNVHYTAAVRRGAGDDQLVYKDVVSLVKQQHMELKDWKVFLCGNEDMIKQLQRHSFFQGAAASDILVDAFVIDKTHL